MTLAWTNVDSPVGKLRLVASPRGLRELHMGDTLPPPPPEAAHDSAALASVADALARYFAGERDALEGLPIEFASGTPFQREVWRALRSIPYGETRSYAWLAGAVGRPKGMRAVGQANGANPIGIVVPCHRVVAADGTLGGYGGGLWRKEVLLGLERGERQGRRARTVQAGLVAR